MPGDTASLLQSFQSLIWEYWYNIQIKTGIQDASNVLCTGLVDFFSEYEGEFGIIIAHEDGARTLRRALQELDSFVSPYYPKGKKPECRKRNSNVLSATEVSVLAVLWGVRAFLIAKASEGVAEPPASTLSSQASLPPPANTATPISEKSRASEPVSPTTSALSPTTAMQTPKTEAATGSTASLENSLLPETAVRPSPATTRTTKTKAAPEARPGPIAALEPEALLGWTTTVGPEETITARTGHGGPNKETPMGRTLKRRRADSSSSVLEKLRRNAREVESLWLAQNEEISKLEAIENDRKNEGQETEALRLKTLQLEEQMRSNQLLQKEVDDAKSGRKKAQGDAQMANEKNSILREQLARVEEERDDAHRKAFCLEKASQKADHERVEAGKELKVAIDLKNGMKDMLMVAGPNLCFGSNFTTETIESAAKAVAEGESAKAVVTEMIRDAMA